VAGLVTSNLIGNGNGVGMGRIPNDLIGPAVDMIDAAVPGIPASTGAPYGILDHVGTGTFVRLRLAASSGNSLLTTWVNTLGGGAREAGVLWLSMFEALELTVQENVDSIAVSLIDVAGVHVVRATLMRVRGPAGPVPVAAV
jgi:hypothetical protein